MEELNSDRKLEKINVISDTENNDLVFFSSMGLIKVHENDDWVAIKIYQDGVNISEKYVINKNTIIRIEYYYKKN